MISIGGIIGAGLFVNSSNAIAAIGPAVTVSYLLTGVIVLFVMRMLGEMAMSHPEAGAFTEFSRLALGPLAGFASGWLYWYFWVIVVAIEAIAGARIVGQWLPDLPVWATGLVLTAALTGSNLLSTRSYGEFEFWFSSIKVAAIIVFIIIAASYACGLTSPHGPTFGNWMNFGGFAPNGWAPVLIGVTTLIFALTGAEIATVAAAEANESEKAIASLSTTLVVRILLFYVGSVGLIVAVIPWNEVKTGLSPFAATLGRIGIPGAELGMNIIVLIAVLSCLNSGIYVASRILFTLAAKGDAPQWLVRVDTRGVPSRAILIAALIAAVAVGASVISPDLVFAFLVNATGALMIFVYLGIVVSQLILRPRTPPENLHIKTWFYPWSGYLTIIAMLAVLGAMAFKKQSAIELGASCACLLVVVICYFVFRRPASGKSPT
ncbi:MAG: amino acid permease [Alphaproteobacteria bacterium]|nr:amino acid permease [Alphaproteobacteria bacterium]